MAVGLFPFFPFMHAWMAVSEFSNLLTSMNWPVWSDQLIWPKTWSIGIGEGDIKESPQPRLETHVCEKVIKMLLDID